VTKSLAYLEQSTLRICNVSIVHAPGYPQDFFTINFREPSRATLPGTIGVELKGTGGSINGRFAKYLNICSWQAFSA
jgi:hypothetical protein